MSNVTYFVALPFIATDDAAAPGQAEECQSAGEAMRRAEALSRKEFHVGAVAFSRTGDPGSGEFQDAKLIKAFGDVPNDLSSL